MTLNLVMFRRCLHISRNLRKYGEINIKVQKHFDYVSCPFGVNRSCCHSFMGEAYVKSHTDAILGTKAFLIIPCGECNHQFIPSDKDEEVISEPIPSESKLSHG